MGVQKVKQIGTSLYFKTINGKVKEDDQNISTSNFTVSPKKNLEITYKDISDSTSKKNKFDKDNRNHKKKLIREKMKKIQETVVDEERDSSNDELENIKLSETIGKVKSKKIHITDIKKVTKEPAAWIEMDSHKENKKKRKPEFETYEIHNKMKKTEKKKLSEESNNESDDVISNKKSHKIKMKEMLDFNRKIKKSKLMKQAKEANLSLVKNNLNCDKKIVEVEKNEIKRKYNIFDYMKSSQEKSSEKNDVSNMTTKNSLKNQSSDTSAESGETSLHKKDFGNINEYELTSDDSDSTSNCITSSKKVPKLKKKKKEKSVTTEDLQKLNEKTGKGSVVEESSDSSSIETDSESLRTDRPNISTKESVSPAKDTEKVLMENLEENNKSNHKSNDKNYRISFNDDTDDDDDDDDDDDNNDNVNNSDGNFSDGELIPNLTSKLKCEVKPEEAKKLKEMNIVLRHDVLPQHEIETGSGSATMNAAKRIEFEKYIKLRKGSFSPQEDKIIKRNWKAFCKMHDWDPRNKKPFIHMRHKHKITYICSKNRRKFVQFLADGLADRSLYSVYHRFQNLFHELKKTRYKELEDITILNYIKQYKYDEMDSPGKRDRKFADLGFMLNRSRASVWRRYRVLKKMLNSDDENDKNKNKKLKSISIDF